jgi:hypothetical protein
LFLLASRKKWPTSIKLTDVFLSFSGHTEPEAEKKKKKNKTSENWSHPLQPVEQQEIVDCLIYQFS